MKGNSPNINENLKESDYSQIEKKSLYWSFSALIPKSFSQMVSIQIPDILFLDHRHGR